MLSKDDFLLPLAGLRTDEIVVTSMGVVRPWGRISASSLDFASADSAMGHTADLALGVAMAQPERRVLCLNGDGSMLMSLGTLATIVEAGAANLVLFVIVNGTYEITGNQRVPGARDIDFCTIARGAGFASVHALTERHEVEPILTRVLREPGPVFVSVAIAPETEGPISRGPSEEAPYLRTSLRDWSHRFRETLSGAGR